ncbi:MAG: class IV adenylate cyclase [Ignavibacteriales bacterium]|nr:class IV adenylate cyclase [Ignavibacteriales bacterium]
MPLNLELKVQIDSHAKLISLLKKQNAEYKGVLVQKDIYFKVKKGLLKLRLENGTYTMIKYLREEKGKRWSNYELLKLEGKNPEKYLRDFLNVETVVEKKRKFYLYNNTRIHLDVVKGLGKFLELETLLVGDKRDAQIRFNDIVELLGLDLTKQIRSSYKILLQHK